MFTRPVWRRRWAVTVAAVSVVVGRSAPADDVSPPAILQDFETQWTTITNRTPDIFAAGYGAVYTPPPGRAESGNQSVGYDVYDRFDLGSAGNPTLYGTAAGLKQMVSSIHAFGGNSYIDLVWNQSGFADSSTPGFAAAGGYPGFALTLQTSNASAPGYNTQGINAVDGDYHSAYATGDQEERLSGLVDIAQESNNVFIRQPTVAGPDNIPGPTPGATGWNGFALANVPNAANAQFYPGTSGSPETFTDPELGGESITRYSFNTSSPMSGTPVAENATGYLMRYAQYMVQVIGADGFRVDAAKNMPEWVMNYLDVATYDASNRTLLNGQQESVFSFSEVYDSSESLLQSYINKNTSSTSATTIGANRDVYDFPLFFAMQSNLTGTTANNNWNNVVGASIDLNDDGLLNGSQGVKFVQSQDDGAPALSSVAYAYTLMLPGNAMVYFNGHQFGTEAQRSFPQDGREDALGGAYGKAITTLVDLRNRYGRGNYRQDYLTTNSYAYERSGSCLVLLSNDTTAGYDAETIDVTFAPGTPLLEQTGNAHGQGSDPLGNIPQLLIVNADTSSPTGSSVNARFLKNSYLNSSGGSVFTGNGYLVYGLPTPQGSLSVTNVSSTFGGATYNTSDANIAYENGTGLVSTIDVVKTATFAVTLNTLEVNLLGYYRDHAADGDNAIIKVDGGVDVSGSGLDTNPNDSASYGFGQFLTVHSPGYTANNGSGGSGTYSQVINTSQLGQGYHYITVEAFRANAAEAVYTDWKQTIYIDTAPPNSAVISFNASTPGVNQNLDLDVSSVDGLANNVHTLLDIGANLTSAQVLAMIGSSTQATDLDVNLWQHYYANVSSGNHSVTVVSYKPDGTYNIQRFTSSQDPYLSTPNTGIGAGIGDLNFDGQINSTDISTFAAIVGSNNSVFNPAADVNGDGLVDLTDAFLMGPVLVAHNASAATFTAYNNFLNNSFVTTHTYNVSGSNAILQDTAGTTNVSAGAKLSTTSIVGNVLTIAAGATVTINPGTAADAGTSRVSSLTLAGTPGAYTAKLDLTSNSLVVEASVATRSSVYAALESMVTQGYDHGKWDGLGIVSSAAAGSQLFSLGVIVNDNGAGQPLFTTFHGQPADDDSILVGYTYVGDANLDGKVDGSDYTLIDNGYAGHLTGWYNGDFNYDGFIDGSDYTLIDNAFNNQGAAFPSTVVAAITAQTAPVPVPEPAAAAALLGGLLVARRRRRVTGFQPVRRVRTPICGKPQMSAGAQRFLSHLSKSSERIQTRTPAERCARADVDGVPPTGVGTRLMGWKPMPRLAALAINQELQ